MTHHETLLKVLEALGLQPVDTVHLDLGATGTLDCFTQNQLVIIKANAANGDSTEIRIDQSHARQLGAFLLLAGCTP